MKIKRIVFAALAALTLGLVSLGEAAVMARGVAGGIGGEFRARPRGSAVVAPGATIMGGVPGGVVNDRSSHATGNE